LSSEDRAAAVARLRRAAERAVELEAEASRLPGPGATGVTLVVDRAGVVRANAAAMESVFQAFGEVDEGRPDDGRPGAVGKVVGAGAGVVLAVVGSAVLGQYEPFSNRLLLAAPNVEAVRASIGADPDDFALWVCLHEQTHRHQFAAAPWLREYLRDLIQRATRFDDEPVKLRRVKASTPAVPPSSGLVGVLSSSSAGPLIAEVTAVMSLLEGYADMLMDTAGAAAIPTMPAIRRAFDERRRHPRRDFGALLRWLFGFTAKIDQYVVGKAFCEAVVREAGIDGLNRAFSSREALPTVDELRNPSAWVSRCLGSSHGDVPSGATSDSAGG